MNHTGYDPQRTPLESVYQNIAMPTSRAALVASTHFIGLDYALKNSTGAPAGSDPNELSIAMSSKME